MRFLLGWVAKKGCFMGQVVEKEIFKLEQRLPLGLEKLLKILLDLLCGKIRLNFFGRNTLVGLGISF